jgi:hypothetical protein
MSDSRGDPWRRPRPGTSTIFLSYHGRDFEAAKVASSILRDEGVTVLLYNPDTRWADATLEILQRILNEAHCVVYVGRWWRRKSRWVRLELEFAVKLGVPVLHLYRPNKAASLVPKIQRLSLLPAKFHLLPFIVNYMDEVMRRHLTAEEVMHSDSLDVWRTGIDVGRRASYELDRAFSRILRID